MELLDELLSNSKAFLVGRLLGMLSEAQQQLLLLLLLLEVKLQQQKHLRNPLVHPELQITAGKIVRPNEIA